MSLSNYVDILLQKVHECLQRVMLDDGIRSCTDMLDENLDITNHQCKIQILMMELFETMNNSAPLITDNMVTNF